MAKTKEYKGHWQNIKYTSPRNPEAESKPYLTYQGRRFYVDQFNNWGNPNTPYTYQEGYTCYILEIDEYGERGRITYCPPSW